MLLQDQHALPSFREHHGHRQAPIAASNDDSIQAVGNLVPGKDWETGTEDMSIM